MRGGVVGEYWGAITGAPWAVRAGLMAAGDERVGLEVRGHGGERGEADAGGGCGGEDHLVDEAG